MTAPAHYLPCHHCFAPTGAGLLEIGTGDQGLIDGWQIACRECGARGPISKAPDPWKKTDSGVANARVMAFYWWGREGATVALERFEQAAKHESTPEAEANKPKDWRIDIWSVARGVKVSVSYSPELAKVGDTVTIDGVRHTIEREQTDQGRRTQRLWVVVPGVAATVHEAEGEE